MAKRTGRTDRPPPVCKAIMLCLRVIEDKLTGLWSIIDTFDEITVSELPATIGPYLLFFQITDGQGRYRITVEIHDLQSDAVMVKEEQQEIELENKHARWTLTLTVPPFEVTQAGLFDVLVLADGQEISRRTIEIKLQETNDHVEAEE